MAGAQWREKPVPGSGNYIRIFDAVDLLTMDEGGDEYTRRKWKAKEGGDFSAVLGQREVTLKKAGMEVD